MEREISTILLEKLKEVLHREKRQQDDSRSSACMRIGGLVRRVFKQ